MCENGVWDSYLEAVEVDISRKSPKCGDRTKTLVSALLQLQTRIPRLETFMDSLVHDLYPVATANKFIRAAGKLGFLIEELKILGLGCTLGDQ